MENEKTFEVTGTFLEKKQEKKFAKKVKAVNEKYAVEKILAGIGSKHRSKRRHIKISQVKEVKENAEKDW